MLRSLIRAAAAAIAIAGAIGSAAAQEATRVRLQLNWFPEAEHGGYYAALVHGFYRDEGLDVTIAPGGVDIPVETLVATGRAQFGVANGEYAIIARAAGANVKALMAPMQRSPRCIMVHADSGIRGLADLRNITIAMSPKDPFSAFVRSKFPLEGCTIVPPSGNVAKFLADRNFAQQAYIISEPFVARSKGGNPHSILIADYGYNPYTSCLIVSDRYLAENRETAAKMVRASLRGWAHYMDDPEETNRHISGLNADMGMEILAYGVEQMQPLVFTEDTKSGGIGTMTADRWNTLLGQLEELKVVEPGKVKAEDAYTMEFLPAPKGS
jgi:NitT/TauT family transport system substrate-binding protein